MAGGQQPFHLRCLPLPTDEAGELDGQVVEKGGERAQGWEVSGQGGMQQLKQMFRLLQVL